MNKLHVFNYHITNENQERLDVYIDGGIVDAESQEAYKRWYSDETSVSFKSFRSDILNSGKKNIRITINSFGGQIGDAMAMHDFIKQLENEGYNIETIGMGMICSASTYPLSAAKNSKISPNSWYMIHNVSGFAYGDVNEMEKDVKNLRKFNDDIRDFYVNLTGKSKKQIEDWMNEEKWFTGKEAVENGFVSSTTDQKEEFKPINQKNWVFKNTNPLNAYNSFIKPENQELDIQNLDMNKFVEAIVNAFKSKNLVVAEEGGKTESLTVENLTSALNDAMKDFSLEPKEPTEEQISNSLTNFFKDGLPENITKQLEDVVSNATKDLPINSKIAELEKELEVVKTDVANSKGGANPPKNNGGTPGKYEHEGISFE